MTVESFAPNRDTSSNTNVESDRLRRKRKQKKKNNKKDSEIDVEERNDSKENVEAAEKVVVEYVPEQPEFEEGFEDDEIRKIFEKFNYLESIAKDEPEVNLGSDSYEGYKENGFFSNNKKKLEKRMNIAELKQMSAKPDVVEACDAYSSDPKLLVFLKSYRNTVPVPRHWSQKRKYLQGKRGMKQPYQLPDFIAATGIEKIREAYIEKEDSKKLKQNQRQRMQQKMEIDYQVLHDAFFKYQTKPKLMTGLGELYFEGKEFEVVKRKAVKPGRMLSCGLKEDLGMKQGDSPPWLINMQRCGPSPSYPNLKIPGLYAPIPLGARFGDHPGGWGYPPVDEYGHPSYGDVFGVEQQDQDEEEEPIDKSKHWGDLEEEEEEDEDEEEEEEEEEEDEDEEQEEVEEEEQQEEVDEEEMEDDFETSDAIELRKEQRKEHDDDRPLYEMLEVKTENVVAPGTLLGTSHTYVINNGGGSTEDKTGGAKRVDLIRGGRKTQRVDVSLDPGEFEAMDKVLPAKYEEAREEEKLLSQREDFSDMVAENEQKRKWNRHDDKEGKKKNKDF